MTQYGHPSIHTRPKEQVPEYGLKWFHFLVAASPSGLLHFSGARMHG